ncbi:SulP family inorganic anion transporter [Geomonas anaerohicana]|uniref:MFS transporter n=1 Tax=Geomonas anaerohicana TaxID=2798583 RepID=A0ABS0YHR2_9BACT|nr:MFS transporter [Geomonas anaerohicana]MBJ6751835.1 MFS transporter [Geomonas anaerohicana]
MNTNKPILFAAGDVNAFFGLMLDNMSGLVIMAGILTGVFGMPRDLVLSRMLPGSAVGVLLGDLLYSWLAWRLARRTGRSDVTAMPLGLDTPSTFGMAFGVIGPCFLATKDAHLTWQVGMATIVLMGVFKVAASFFGPALRRSIPRAGLLGSIAAVALLLIAYLPFLKLFASPVVGFLSLGIVFISLLARYRLPLGLPGALAGIAVGTVAYYLLGAAGLLPGGAPAPLAAPQLALYLPLPSLEFLGGVPRALGYLPLAIPFALATVVGGVDVTESAAVAGDDYNTRDILLVEGVATLVAGMCGGVMQSCPYIGHPAYKDMGGRAGYTIATALFIGAAAVTGYLSFLVGLLPEAAVAPILIFIGIEITAQAFEATKKTHYRAVAVSFIPVIACLTTIEFGQMLGGLGKSAADLTGDLLATWQATTILGNGFIVTSLLWGAAFANVLDHRPGKAAVYLLLCSALSLCGIIHSPLASGAMFSPLAPPQPIVWHLAAGYAAMAFSFWLLSLVGSASAAGE